MKKYFVTDGTWCLLKGKGKGNYYLRLSGSVDVKNNAYKTKRGAETFLEDVNEEHGFKEGYLFVEEKEMS